ncbi:class I SAM-dependent methyltransferase [Thalassomonas viridans]|uniref:Class I SAM-dependent methyltransferase n=1 Tax=Thalassomonas viridans TaxID=137584 RepID=A0AAF0C8E9_9GAMM|nr:class I SAM-dependent methyltransferase [Thalassomonas viridans]WDE04291.1 class I SAM-dependent methyltransferase [Thalassomonas viridans]
MPLFEILLLLLFVLIAFSIIWSTLAVGISPMPSSAKARQAMLNLCRDTGSGRITDFGSGWGHFVIAAAKAFPDRQITGYELSLCPYLTAYLLKLMFRLDNLTLKRRDFLTADLGSTSVLVCYLYPGAMKAIENKLATDQHRVDYIISNNFACPNLTPIKTLQLDDFYRSPVYLYHL